MFAIALSGYILIWLSVLSTASPILVEQPGQELSSRLELRSSEPQHFIELYIGLSPDDPHLLEQTLYSVSDPSSRLYGKYLTREEAQALLQPREETVSAVRQWLSEYGVSQGQIKELGHLIYVNATMPNAESLFRSRFSESAPTDDNHVQTRDYSVPDRLKHHISFIHQTSSSVYNSSGRKEALNGFRKESTQWRLETLANNAVINPKKSHDRGSRATCKTQVTPACLQKLYHIENNSNAKRNPKALLGIAGFDGVGNALSHILSYVQYLSLERRHFVVTNLKQTAQFSQLTKFLELYAPYARSSNISVTLVNGGENPQGEYPSGEANLDVQYAISLAPDVPVRYYATGGENHDFNPDLDIYDKDVAYTEPFLEFAQYLLDLEDDELPQVLSISYGSNEQHYPKEYAKRVCDMFGQLGARGVSVIIASGDSGPGASCQTNDGKKSTRFLPSFPPTCPYVTSVGGVGNFDPEIASDFSSGGFSELWPRPKWQERAVKRYLRAYGDEWKGYYNQNGRGFPDIAVQSSNFQILNHGQVESASGTSAAAPVFAAMISHVNNKRAACGKPPLGFLNPWIYEWTHFAFTDIIKGGSTGCDGESVWGLPSPMIPGAGWRAVSGWDPVTGIGTPQFDRLNLLACL